MLASRRAVRQTPNSGKVRPTGTTATMAGRALIGVTTPMRKTEGPSPTGGRYAAATAKRPSLEATSSASLVTEGGATPASRQVRLITSTPSAVAAKTNVVAEEAKRASLVGLGLATNGPIRLCRRQRGSRSAGRSATAVGGSASGLLALSETAILAIVMA